MQTRAELDRAARQAGYQNYDQYVAWKTRTHDVVLGGNPGGQPAPTNWLQNLLAKIPGHPANTLGYVNEKMKKALGK